MKPKTRRLLNFLFIAATLGLLFVFAFSNNELANAWEALFTMKIEWVIMAFLGWFGYLFFDSMCLHQFLKRQDNTISIRRTLFISLIGFYYSNITPGASGGQPMQVYYLNKNKVPIGIGTSALSIKFLCSQLMMVLIGSVLWICNAQFVQTELASVKWLLICGLIINGAAVPLVLMIAFCRHLVQVLCNGIIHLGAKIRLIKDEEGMKVRVASTLDTYHASILAISKKPWQILEQIFYALLSILSLYSVTLSVYYAFGLSGTPWYQIMTVASLLFLSVSFTPLPGASGAQEGGFLLFYRNVFTGGTKNLALLIWRFFTYYMFLLVGGVITIVINARGMKPKKEELEAQQQAIKAAEEKAANDHAEG